MDLDFPPGFELGVATSSWQIEGDVAGRGLCNWDDFAQIPGAIVDGATGEPACDHVHRLDEDLDLLAWLGVDAYRFSISWPRVMPTGQVPVALRASTSTTGSSMACSSAASGPWPRCSTGTCRAPLEHAGGWPERDTAYRFADYAQAMGERYADRVDRWATLNEPWCSAFLGYCSGYFAPGRTEPGASLAAVYHLILGHGLAIQRLRETGARNLGIVLNLIPVVSESPSMDAATRHIDGLQNRIFLDLLAGNGVPSDVRESCASVTDWGFVRDDDTSILSAPIDWLGENYYTVIRVAEPGAAAPRRSARTRRHPRMPARASSPHGPRSPTWAGRSCPKGSRLALRKATDHLPGRAAVDLRERRGSGRGDRRHRHPRPDPHGVHR